MKYLLSLFVMVVSNVSKSQDVDSLKNFFIQIIGKSNNNFEQNNEQFNQLLSIINLDPIEYFKLKEKYNSPLKIEMFKQTGEYTAALEELKSLRKSMLQKTFYIDFYLSKYGKENFKYNPSSQSFNFLIDSKVSEYSSNNEISFDHFFLNKVSGITSQNTILSVDTYEYLRQQIKLKTTNLKEAVSIEDNSENIRILFLFKIQGSQPFLNNVSGIFTFQDYIIKGFTQKVIVYNEANSQILKVYNATDPKK